MYTKLICSDWLDTDRSQLFSSSRWLSRSQSWSNTLDLWWCGWSDVILQSMSIV